MKPFTQQEKKVTAVILLIILIVSLFNFRIALRRSRDAQRRSDVNALVGGLIKYKDATGVFPLASENGRLKACEPPDHAELLKRLDKLEINSDEYFASLRPCVWGNEPLVNLLSLEKNELMKTIPTDPRHEGNFSYLYISTGRFFQVFAYLEGAEDEEGYNNQIVARNLKCGKHICNFGKAFEKTPLDKTLQEYENELVES